MQTRFVLNNAEIILVIIIIIIKNIFRGFCIWKPLLELKIGIIKSLFWRKGLILQIFSAQ